jgi:hypothetical protein
MVVSLKNKVGRIGLGTRESEQFFKIKKKMAVVISAIKIIFLSYIIQFLNMRFILCGTFLTQIFECTSTCVVKFTLNNYHSKFSIKNKLGLRQNNGQK